MWVEKSLQFKTSNILAFVTSVISPSRKNRRERTLFPIFLGGRRRMYTCYKYSKYEKHLPMILEERRDIVHYSRQKTRHTLLLIASKHHVQNWGEHLG